jgi:hypothetical protein
MNGHATTLGRVAKRGKLFQLKAKIPRLAPVAR